jgi:hypothetical protein
VGFTGFIQSGKNGKKREKTGTSQVDGKKLEKTGKLRPYRENFFGDFSDTIWVNFVPDVMNLPANIILEIFEIFVN